MKSIQQQNAERWEKYIRLECKALNNAKRAYVSKNFEAPKAPGTNIPREKSKPDFSGFRDDGTHIVFDAKSTKNKTSFAFSLISKHQMEHLSAANKYDAISFVYVLDFNDDKYVVPISVIEATEKKSLKFSEIEKYKKKTGESFLDVLNRLDRESDRYMISAWGQDPVEVFHTQGPYHAARFFVESHAKEEESCKVEVNDHLGELRRFKIFCTLEYS